MHLVRLIPCLALSLLCRAQAAEPVLSLAGDGSQVHDSAARLAWQRCVEGMTWSGKTCVGTPRLLTHMQALAAAAERRRLTGEEWRVPRLQELKRLSVARAQADLEGRLFPFAPPGWYWTSTARVDTSAVNPYDYGNVRRGVTEQNVNRIEFMHGWAVHDLTGEASGAFTKKTHLAVRLVRSLER